VDIIDSKGAVTDTPHQVKVVSTGKVLTAKDIILAPGSIPFVPRGVQADEKTVFTSDGGLKLEFVPQVMQVVFLSNVYVCMFVCMHASMYVCQSFVVNSQNWSWLLRTFVVIVKVSFRVSCAL
jgi:hypothetical protein